MVSMASNYFTLILFLLSICNFVQSRNVFRDSTPVAPLSISNQSEVWKLNLNEKESLGEKSKLSATHGRISLNQLKFTSHNQNPEPLLKLSDILKRSKANSLALNHRLNLQTLSKLNVSSDDLLIHDILLHLDNLRHRSLFGVDLMKNEIQIQKTKSNHTVKNESLHFRLFGATYPNGLYYTTVQLGNPAQTFKVSIDTGSNLLWVNCQPCDPCVTSNTQQLNPPYDRTKSKTVIPVACGSSVCTDPDFTVSTDKCSADNADADCAYGVSYGDASTSQGVLLNETIWLPVTSQPIPVPVRMIFGCGTSQSGLFITGLTFTVYQGLDGLLGLGRGNIGLVNTLNKTYSSHHVDNVFSHCLGGINGGGSLLFGSVNVPSKSVVYTSLKYDPSFYRVSLISILVGGRPLSVPPILYGNTRFGNTAFDSGTTYTQLPTRIFDVLVNAIKVKVGLKPIFDNPLGNKGILCFSPTSSISLDDILKMYPTITLQFEGKGTFLNIYPSTYVFAARYDNYNISCTRFIPTNLIQTKLFLNFIIGDLWMRDLLIIHDLKNLRIGWTPMKCLE